MQILIVDDEPIITQFFARLAALRGYADVDTAGTGEEALARVLRRTYDLITVDLSMPGVGGLEIIGMLRHLNPHAVIAIVSGYLPDEIPAEVAGCVDVMVSKPVSADTFGELLDATAVIAHTLARIRLLGACPVTAS